MSDTNTAGIQQTSDASPAAASPGDGAGDFDARLAALKGDGGAVSEPAPEGSASVPPAPSEADSAAARSQARAARLAEMSARLRRQVDSRPAQPSEDYATKYAEAQKRLQEMEAARSKYVDPTALDEAGFFELASRLQVSPQKLGEYLRTATLNPEIAAAESARKALDPRITAAEERAAAAERRVEEFLQQQMAQQARAQEEAVVHGFIQSVSPDEAPLTASFIRQFGAGEFRSLMQSAANGLPDGAGRQALLDVIESNLEQLVRGLVPSPPSSAKQTTPSPIPAAAKATTVSNAHAQERASVVEDDDWASLPFEVRLERMKASA